MNLQLRLSSTMQQFIIQNTRQKVVHKRVGWP